MHALLLAAALANLSTGDGADRKRADDQMASLSSSADAASRRDDLKIRARYRQSIERGTGGVAVFSQLFYVDVRLRFHAEALEVGRRYIGGRPNDAHFRLDYAYELRRAQRPEAHSFFQQLAASANSEIAQRARAELRATGPGEHVGQDPAVSEGYAALKKGNRSAAIADFRRHLAAFPKDAQVLLDLAFAQDAAGDHASSLTSLERYGDLRPGDQRAGLQRAYELDAVGQHSAALELFGKLTASSDSVASKGAKDALARPRAGADSSDNAALAASYAKLQADDRSGAIAGFFQHLDSHPDDADVWLALSYAQAGDKEPAASLTSLDHYLALRPGDAKAELQRAFDLDALGRHDDARAIYRRLVAFNDPEVAATARRQLASFPVQRAGSSETWIEWDSRLRDTLYGVDLNLQPNSVELQPYAALHFSNDSRSGRGPVPTVFNDNAAIAALGLRAKIAPGAYLYSEGGEFVGLLNQGTFPTLRIGLQYHGQLGETNGTNTSFDFDVSHYSYYAGDLISYGTARHLIPIDHRFAVMLGANLGLDGQTRYYNNFLEGLAGIQISTPHVKLRLAQVYGSYIRGSGAPAPHYWSFRPIVFYDVRF